MSTLPRTVGELKALPPGTVLHTSQGMYYLKATPSTEVTEGLWILSPDAAHRLSPLGSAVDQYFVPPGLHTDSVYAPETPGLFLILVEMAEIKVKAPMSFTGRGQTRIEVWIPLPHDATAQGILLQDAAKHEGAVVQAVHARVIRVEPQVKTKDFTLSGPWAVATFLKEESPVRSNPKRFPGGSVGDEPIIVPVDANTQIEIVQSGRKLFAVTLTDPQEGWSLDDMFWVEGSLEDAKEEGRRRAKQLNIKSNPKTPSCWGSKARVGLSLREAEEGRARCSRCGLLLKVRVHQGKEGSAAEGTFPVHPAQPGSAEYPTGPKQNPRESSYDSDGVKQITIKAHTRQTPESTYPVYLLRLTRTARKSWQPYVVGYEIYDKHPYEDQQARRLGEGSTIDEAIQGAQSAIYVRYSE